MRTRKQKLLLAVKIISAFFVLIIALALIFRNTILQKAMVKVSEKMERDYDCNFTVKKAEFEGFSGVAMQDVLLIPKHADTLFRVESLKTRINYWKLLTGDVQLGSLEAKNGFMKLSKNGADWNFKTFMPKKDTVDTGEK